MGLLTYDGGLAVGPRQRYSRAITRPSFRGRDKKEDASAWLNPCLFVRESHRGQGVTGPCRDAARPGSVVIPARQQVQVVALDSIDQAVFLVNAA